MFWRLVLTLLYYIVLTNLPKLLKKVIPRKLFRFFFHMIYELKKITPPGIRIVSYPKDFVE